MPTLKNRSVCVVGNYIPLHTHAKTGGQAIAQGLLSAALRIVKTSVVTTYPEADICLLRFIDLSDFEKVSIVHATRNELSSSLALYKALRRLSSTTKFDVIHLANAPLFLPIFLKTDKNLRRSKVVKHVFMPSLRRPVGDLLTRLLSIIVYSQFVDAITVTCNKIRTLVVDLGANPNEVYIVPPSIDTELYSPNALHDSGWNSPFEGSWLFYLGDLDPRRFSIQKILFALKILKNEGTDVSLLVAARYYPGDAERIRMMMRIADEMGLNGQVKAYNYKLGTMEKIRLFHCSDAVIFPFSTGATNVDPPISLLEAMSSGGTVIVTNHRSIPEVVTDGFNGFIVDTLSSQRLSQVIQHILQDETCCRARQHARNTVLRRFSIREVSKTLTEIYTEILG